MGNFWLTGIGSDIFGEEATARKPMPDYINDHFRTKYLKDYLKWHQQNRDKHPLHPNFDEDLRRMSYFNKMQWVSAFGGVLFATMVVNRNYRRRRSWYIKKFNCFICACIPMQWYRTQYDEALLQLMLRNYDYFPYAVQRTLKTKDHRYLVEFNYKNPERPLFDEKTGKSIA